VRLVFLGTPEMAVPPLRAVVDAGHDVELVVTRPDRRRGRGASTSPSPVAAAARALGLRVSHDVDDVVAAGAELGVVVAYGRLISERVLQAVPMVNIHFSLLPRWRGAAPVERALLAGDAETGVSLMAVERELDAGAVYTRRTLPIGPRATAAELRAELVVMGTAMLVDLLGGPLPDPQPQQGEVTYAVKLDADDLLLDWGAPASDLDLVVRVGGAWTTWRGERIKVVSAVPVDVSGPPGTLADARAGTIPAGDGGLRLDVVQPAGRAAMTWTAFANGARPVTGERLGQ